MDNHPPALSVMIRSARDTPKVLLAGSGRLCSCDAPKEQIHRKIGRYNRGERL